MLLGSISSPSFAEEYSFPCPWGGEIITAGSWNSRSGEVTFSTNTNNCIIEEGLRVEMNGMTTGTFKVMALNIIEVNLTTDLSARLISVANGEFNRTINGMYDLNTGRLNGENNNTSKWDDETGEFKNSSKWEGGKDSPFYRIIVCC